MCRTALVVFLVLYLLAIGIFLTGTFGLFGNERDPLAGVFLIPLGWPWIWCIDWFPEFIHPWLAAATPAVNLAVLYFACRLFRSRQKPPA